MGSGDYGRMESHTDGLYTGVHPIFGAFLVGLIIPHQHGFARKTTEKLDDLVSLLFLPIVSAIVPC